MVAVLIDDEALALRATEKAIRSAMPDADVHTFVKSEELLDFAVQNHIDIAFLDINMRGITGLELAEKLEVINPRMNIIFVTGFNDYKSEAMDLHASGYIMKPATAEDILNEIRFLRFPVTEGKRVTVKCFGNFSVLIDGVPPVFLYSKTKELFAYLIDRQGAIVSNNELSAILWENDNHTNYFKRLRSDLKNTFERSGCGDVILSQKGSLGVDVAKISCDYFDFLNKVKGSEHFFRGEYMSQYSWAEMTLGNLLGNY